MTLSKILIGTLFLSFLFCSCSSKPVLYPNEKLQAVGKEAAYEDVNRCMNAADNYMESGRGKRIARSAGKGAIFGGAVGAVGGLLSGDLTSGVIGGAAIGGTAGGVGEALSPDQIKHQYVNRCLARMGYEVIGWD
ncbi:MAG: cell envelope biogenesis protein OmpA [Pseudomonadota bacterium]